MSPAHHRARVALGLTGSGWTLYLIVFASSFSAKWYPPGGMMREVAAT
jgi:hypothetical protein